MKPDRPDDVRVSDNAESLATGAARHVIEVIQQAVASRGRAVVALAGGSTPLLTYEKLAGMRESVPWEAVHFFWGDERAVLPTHTDSNYRMARESLLRHIPVVASNIHRMIADAEDADHAAREYEQAIRTWALPGEEGSPAFDLVLLGMGEDGHTASLFPGSPALDEVSRLVVMTDGPEHRRMTLTLPCINGARNIMVIVSGKEKAKALTAVMGSGGSTSRLPIKLVRPAHGSVAWFVDRQAASLL